MLKKRIHFTDNLLIPHLVVRLVMDQIFYLSSTLPLVNKILYSIDLKKKNHIRSLLILFSSPFHK